MAAAPAFALHDNLNTSKLESLENQLNIIKYQQQFIEYIKSHKIIIFGKKVFNLVDELARLAFPKLSQKFDASEDEKSYDYLTNMPMQHLNEKVSHELKAEYESKTLELDQLQKERSRKLDELKKIFKKNNRKFNVDKKIKYIDIIYDMYIYNIIPKVDETTDRDLIRNIGSYYKDQHRDIDSMMKYYRMAISKGCSIAALNAGIHYQKIKDEVKMIEYYEQAIKLGNSDAALNLGSYYYKKDEAKMIKYYEQALELKNYDAAYGLGHYYGNEKKDNDKLVHYYTIGAKENQPNCVVGLACYYRDIGDYSNMIIYLTQGIANGNKKCMYYMALFCEEQDDEVGMLEYLDMAGENGRECGYHDIGLHYFGSKDIDRMKKYLMQSHAIHKHCSRAMYILGCHYEDAGDVEDMIKCFQLAVDRGSKEAMDGMARYWSNKDDFMIAQQYIDLAEKTEHKCCAFK